MKKAIISAVAATVVVAACGVFAVQLQKPPLQQEAQQADLPLLQPMGGGETKNAKGVESEAEWEVGLNRFAEQHIAEGKWEATFPDGKVLPVVFAITDGKLTMEIGGVKHPCHVSSASAGPLPFKMLWVSERPKGSPFEYLGRQGVHYSLREEKGRIVMNWREAPPADMLHLYQPELRRVDKN